MLQSTISPAALVTAAKVLHYHAIAQTDVNTTAGLLEFYCSARAHSITPIMGVVIDNPHDPFYRERISAEKSESGRKQDYTTVKAYQRNPHHYCILLAKNYNGYTILCRTVSRRLCDTTFNYTQELAELDDSVIVLSADTTLFPIFAERRPHNTYAELIPPHTADERRQYEHVRRMAEQYRLPLAAGNNVRFLRPHDYEQYRIRAAIGHNETCTTLPNHAAVGAQRFMLSPWQMRKAFYDCPEALINTERIAQQCNCNIDLDTLRFPRFHSNNRCKSIGTTNDQLNKQHVRSSEHRLRELVHKGLRKRYPIITDEIAQKAHYELQTIITLGFTDYFLICHDIIRYAAARKYRYLGRGSAANSIIAFALELTNICPVKYHLYFERFLNPERQAPPDIDLDFSWKDRDDIIDYITRRFGGEEKVAMIGTIVTFKKRMALREVGKVMGLSNSQLTALTAIFPSWGEGSFKNPHRQYPECRDFPIQQEPYSTIIQHAEKLTGTPRHLSIHAGGMVISDVPLWHYTGIERSPKGVIITQQDMYDIEKWGLVKIDILSQRSLGVLNDAITMIEKNHILTPPVDNFTVITGDPATKELIRTARTIGCFYIESPAMRGLLAKLMIDDFEHLTAASSVIRPGVASSGMMQEYIDRHHHPERITFAHPKMAEFLKETYGVMVYQEDVIKTAHHIGGLSCAEADILRRAMSGKHRGENTMKTLQKRFFYNCRRNGMHDSVIADIWQQMKSFAGYAFCKAHSGAYAVLSFQVAYLKAHYPAEFLCAVLRNHGGYYRQGVYIQEAKRLGIAIKLPDINKSEKEATVIDGSIHLGLRSISQVSKKSIRSLINARPYRSFGDFLHRSHIGRVEAILLVQCGAADCFGKSRTRLLWELYAQYNCCTHHTDSVLPMEISIPRLTGIRDTYTDLQYLQIEYATFGYFVTTHPMKLFNDYLPMHIPAAEISLYAGKRITVAGWLISSRRITTTGEKKKPMKFISLDDTTGEVRCIIFPAVYDRFAHHTIGSGIFVATGIVQKTYDAYDLIVEQIENINLEALAVRIRPTLHRIQHHC